MVETSTKNFTVTVLKIAIMAFNNINSTYKSDMKISFTKTKVFKL